MTPTFRNRSALRLGRPDLIALRLRAPQDPAYMHGEAYPATHQSAEAAAEFQKILDHRGIVVSDPIGALAQLQLGRAFAVEAGLSRHGTDGGVKPPLPPEALAKAKAAYLDFLTLWKDADPDIPILQQAKAEYAKLQ